jgi:hypothetical protein
MGTVSLRVESLEAGGFVVFDHGSDFPLFAASTIDDALNYVRLKMRRGRETSMLPTEDEIAKAGPTPLGTGKAALYRDTDAFKRGMDQGALSREAMSDAVHRRNGTWRV